MLTYQGSAAVYLKEISKFKPLSAAEEHELALFICGEVSAVNALKRLVRKSAEGLTENERDLLVSLVRENPNICLAIKKLTEANALFAVYEAFKFKGRGLPTEELIGLANEGLIIAAINFKPDQGAKFISYAVWWVKQVILKALAENKSVRPPINVVDGARGLADCDQQLSQALGRHPYKEEVKGELSIDEQEYTRLRALQEREPSLDTPVFEENNDLLWRDALPDDDSKPDDILAHKEFCSTLNEIMERCLTDREANILKLLWGFIELKKPPTRSRKRTLKHGKQATFEEVGEEIGVTRERVRQATEIAMKKLRAGFKRRHLDLASLI
ncbi:MAG: sigma-70 family RNA polymerase sigma factor [bacterium]|nr:sigma-70 family RNA polymerase sigma factor [bacterium]